MAPPEDTSLSFFAYGIFKPKQLGYYRLHEFVRKSQPGYVTGKLFERDGVPLFHNTGTRRIHGDLIDFRAESAEEAYERISEMEPEKQYDWNTTEVQFEDRDSYRANVLVGRVPKRGGSEIESSWDGRDDPLFTTALNIVEQKINEVPETVSHEKGDMVAFFHLHMAYLLLWSAIERYLSLRYGLKAKVIGGRSGKEKRSSMANEDGFRRGLTNAVPPERVDHEIHSSVDPGYSKKLDLDDPEEAIEYYYLVRNNVAHRGKTIRPEYNLLRSSIEELNEIFHNYVLKDAFESSDCL